MYHRRRAAAAAIAVLSLTLSTLSPLSARAEEIGPGIGLSSSGKTVTSETGAPSTVTDVKAPENLDLDSIVAGAGLSDLGEGNTPPDPILGEVPMLHYGLWNTANAEITGTESNLNTYLYLKEGFPRLYINHSGIGRYYLRVYTKNHGWYPWQNSGEPTPNPDEADKIQAIQLRVKGYTGNLDDLYYKVVLSDGTVLDWAKNGQTTGAIGNDSYIVAIKIALWNKANEFPGKTETLMEAPAYEGTYVSAEGNVEYSSASPYTGWGYHNNDPYYFIEGVRQTGWQYVDGYKYYFDESGRLVKDLEPLMGLTGDYRLMYNKSTKTMYVMAKDGANGYIIPFKTFMSSCGPETPLGTYSTYAKYNWKLMHDNIYCQYLTRFKGSFLMHSIIFFDRPTSHNLDSSTYNHIDDAVSGGCIRLLSGDAAWIYYNCPMHTSITIYSDPWNKGPVEKDAIEKPIPREQNYDPTDPVIVAQQQAEAAAAAEAARLAEEAAKQAANTTFDEEPALEGGIQ